MSIKYENTPIRCVYCKIKLKVAFFKKYVYKYVKRGGKMKKIEKLLVGFEYLIYDLKEAHYYSIAEILKGLKQVFIKEYETKNNHKKGSFNS